MEKASKSVKNVPNDLEIIFLWKIAKFPTNNVSTTFFLKCINFMLKMLKKWLKTRKNEKNQFSGFNLTYLKGSKKSEKIHEHSGDDIEHITPLKKKYFES